MINFLSYVFGAQNDRLIEMVLLSTHNICFSSEIRKQFSVHTLIWGPAFTLSQENEIEKWQLITSVQCILIPCKISPVGGRPVFPTYIYYLADLKVINLRGKILFHKSQVRNLLRRLTFLS